MTKQSNGSATLSVDDYVSSVPISSKQKFDELRLLAKTTLPNAKEVISYGILGYKIGERRPIVFVSGWKDHVAVYPVPDDEALESEISKYRKGKGTLWFALDKPLPKKFIKSVILSHHKAHIIRTAAKSK